MLPMRRWRNAHFLAFAQIVGLCSASFWLSNDGIDALMDDLEPPIELVIFDCDGVLVDSEVISARMLIEQLAVEGIDVDFSYVQKNFLGRSFATVVCRIQTSFGYELPADFEQRYREGLVGAFQSELNLVDGVQEVLAALSVPACVATSSNETRAMKTLELAGLATRFRDRIFTASQVAHGKPAPDLFLHAAKCMGVSPEQCLVVEDSLPGVEAARAAGMRVWRFTGASHLATNGQQGELTDETLTVFDKWSEFFDMAPQLKSHSTTL